MSPRSWTRPLDLGDSGAHQLRRRQVNRLRESEGVPDPRIPSPAAHHAVTSALQAAAARSPAEMVPLTMPHLRAQPWFVTVMGHEAHHPSHARTCGRFMNAGVAHFASRGLANGRRTTSAPAPLLSQVQSPSASSESARVRWALSESITPRHQCVTPTRPLWTCSHSSTSAICFLMRTDSSPVQPPLMNSP